MHDDADGAPPPPPRRGNRSSDRGARSCVCLSFSDASLSPSPRLRYSLRPSSTFRQRDLHAYVGTRLHAARTAVLAIPLGLATLASVMFSLGRLALTLVVALAIIVCFVVVVVAL
ncbi:putative integral membrane protein [Leishmania donovani]|uniref:Putative integral membrane protein n=1 Tax=Leishmania donovani TaxID=5661 RepID=A0A504XJZ5_LEIDO|nr:putative integral membrane protein [Leishmania donovani]